MSFYPIYAASLIVMVSVCAIASSDARSPLKGYLGVYYPPAEVLRTALDEFSAFPKKAEFQGNHAIGDGGASGSTRFSQRYPGVASAEELEKARKAFQENGEVPNAAWVGYWMRKSDKEIYEMISPENPRSLVPNYFEGHPLRKSNLQALVPMWGKRNYFYSPKDGSEWGPGMEVINPGTGKPVVIQDSGSGWSPPEGFPVRSSFKFVAAYRSYLIRKLIYYPYNGEHGFDGPDSRQNGSAIYALAYAYAVTGEQVYADRVFLILSTLARYYPDYTSLDDTGVGWQGYPFRSYVDDHNFENGMIVNMALAYDLVFKGAGRSETVVNFLNEKGGAIKSPEELTSQIESRLFAYSWEFVRRAIPGASGNMLFRQLQTGLVLANVFRNDAILRYILEGPKGLNHALIGSFYREGRFWEDSCTYCWVVHHAFIDSLGQLSHYRSEQFPEGVELSSPAKATASSLIHNLDEWQVSGRMWGIGDTKIPRHSVIDPSAPFQTTWTAHETGLTLLRMPNSRENGRAALLFHGNAGYGHGHEHQLMLKIFGMGYDFSGDLGYPANFTHPKWTDWTRGTLSHPTVVVDQRSQNVGTTASLGIRAESPWAAVASAYSNNVYLPGAVRGVSGSTPASPKNHEPVSTYHRTAVLLQVSEGQEVVVDLFRVIGGHCHDLPFHAPAGDADERFLLEGAVMGEASPGTLAGEDVAYGTAKHEGYSYLKEVREVQRVAAGSEGEDKPNVLRATWRPEENGPGYRISIPASFSGKVMVAKGEGEGPLGASPWDRYLLLRNEAQKSDPPLSTLFVAVHEVFTGKPLDFELLTQPIDALAPETMPVKVELRLADGVVWSIESVLAGQPSDYSARGREMLRVTGPSGVMAVNWQDSHISPKPLAGKVSDVDYTANEVTLDTRQNLAGLTGHLIAFNHPSYTKATTFEIKSVKKLSRGKWRIALKQHPVLATSGVRKISSNRRSVAMDRVSEKLLAAVTLFDGKVAAIGSTVLPGRVIAAEMSPMGADNAFQKIRLSEPIPGEVSSNGDVLTLYDYGIGDDAFINLIQINPHGKKENP